MATGKTNTALGEAKADEVYEREVKQAIERFMKEQVTKMSGDIVR